MWLLNHFSVPCYFRIVQDDRCLNLCSTFSLIELNDRGLNRKSKTEVGRERAREREREGEREREST